MRKGDRGLWLVSRVAVIALCAACAPSVPPTQAQSPTPSRPDSALAPASAESPTHPAWLVSDSAGRTATIAIQVTAASDGARINGRRNGELQIIVPLGWTIQWDWRSADAGAPHSLVVMAEREKLPGEGGAPAFSNAMTRMVTGGLEAGQGDRTTFTADQAGWYWMLCGVPGHALGGEYVGLRVNPEAAAASVRQPGR